MKRLFAAGFGLLLAACATPSAPVATSGWIGAWGAAPAPPPATNARSFENQTVRQALRISAAGTRVRVRLTNEYGDKPLAIGAASIAKAGTDGAATGAPVALTFGGRTSAVIPPKSPLLSDPVDLSVAALEMLSVSLYLPEATGPCTCHSVASQTAFFSAPGNFAMTTFEPAGNFTSRAFISGVEVMPAKPTSVIVTFGDSITDGTRSTVNANARWPDFLAQRLQAGPNPPAIVNAAISGNRVLNYQLPIFGEAALARLDRDVLSVPGARWMTVLEGINDIGMGRPNPPGADQITAGYRQIIERAHAHGVKVIGATLLPYEGATYYDANGETIRQQVNQWIRTSGAFDGVIDFDAVMKDPANAKKMRADLQSGDWLHPNDAGYKVMADAVDLGLFR